MWRFPLDISARGEQNILGAILVDLDLDTNEKILCNLFILTTKWIIWKHRNEVKHNVSKKLCFNRLTKKVCSTVRTNINILLSSGKKDQLSDESILMLEHCERMHVVLNCYCLFCY